MEASVNLGVNVELLKGTKFERFLPEVGWKIVMPGDGLTEEEQMAWQVGTTQKMWKMLSKTIEGLINEELDYEVKWGKSK